MRTCLSQGESLVVEHRSAQRGCQPVPPPAAQGAPIRRSPAGLGARFPLTGLEARRRARAWCPRQPEATGLAAASPSRSSASTTTRRMTTARRPSLSGSSPTFEPGLGAGARAAGGRSDRFRGADGSRLPDRSQTGDAGRNRLHAGRRAAIVGSADGGRTASETGQGPFRVFPDTAPELRFPAVGLTGFEPATP